VGDRGKKKHVEEQELKGKKKKNRF